MRRWLCVLVLVAGASIVALQPVQAQTRADTAAVLLNAAERLRVQGELAAARALLQLIGRDYAGTPAAAEVETMLALVQRMPAREQSGRTELMVWGATYGAWLGVALPLMADAEEPEVYGVGLLLGAPAGFFAARAYGAKHRPTEGQARAITFGGTWGTFQGFGWGQYFDVGSETLQSCAPPELGLPCEDLETDADGPSLVAAALAGGIAGIVTGALLARKPITSGTATAVSHGGLWGTWFGFGLSYVAGSRDDDLLASALVGGNVALIATGIMAPAWRLSENRARLISIAGVIGGIVGGGLVLILQPDDDETGVAIPVATSALGLGLGAHYTRNYDARADDGGSPGALLDRNHARWSLDVPEPRLQLRRDGRRKDAAVFLPLLEVRF